MSEVCVATPQVNIQPKAQSKEKKPVSEVQATTPQVNTPPKEEKHIDYLDTYNWTSEFPEERAALAAVGASKLIKGLIRNNWMNYPTVLNFTSTLMSRYGPSIGKSFDKIDPKFAEILRNTRHNPLAYYVMIGKFNNTEALKPTKTEKNATRVLPLYNPTLNDDELSDLAEKYMGWKMFIKEAPFNNTEQFTEESVIPLCYQTENPSLYGKITKPEGAEAGLRLKDTSLRNLMQTPMQSIKG